MKRNFFYLLGATALFFASCVENPEGKKAETTEASNAAGASATGTLFTIDPAASSVEWLGKKVTGQHHGTVQIKSGEVFVDNGQLTGGSFVLDLNTIDNKDLEGEYKGKLEGHLKSADFFDVENHPEASFQITSVKPGTAEGQVIVSGNLTLRGVTKNITFDATIEEATASSFKAFADFNIAREDWGVNYSGKADDLISKEINLKINMTAVNG